MLTSWITFFSILALSIFIPILILVIVKRKFPKLKQFRKECTYYIAIFVITSWLIDFFYMATFCNSLILKLTFGCLLLFTLLGSASLPLMKIWETHVFEKWLVAIELFEIVGLTIYLIYLIPDQSSFLENFNGKLFREISTTIIAAVYGGLITLAGVAWTIKKSDKDRKDDEINKAKPIFSFNPQLKECKIDGTTKACFTPIEYANSFSCEAHVEIENSDKSPFNFLGVFHDGNWYPVEGNKTVLPSGKCYLTFDFSNPLNIFLAINDSLGNGYLYALKVLALPSPNSIGGQGGPNGKIFHTLREIEEISKKDFDNSIIKKDTKESRKDGSK